MKREEQSHAEEELNVKVCVPGVVKRWSGSRLEHPDNRGYDSHHEGGVGGTHQVHGQGMMMVTIVMRMMMMVID